jgi:hypothetical protein
VPSFLHQRRLPEPSSISDEGYANSAQRAEFFACSIKTNERREQQGLLSKPDLVVKGRKFWKWRTLLRDAQELAARCSQLVKQSTGNAAVINPENEEQEERQAP